MGNGGSWRERASNLREVLGGNSPVAPDPDVGDMERAIGHERRNGGGPAHGVVHGRRRVHLPH